MLALNKIYFEDCLKGMEEIDDHTIDMILCDLPYGTTQLEWDIAIPFGPLWSHYERIIKEDGAIVLTGSQPFTTDIINSNRMLFRYEIIWEKTVKSGFFDANRRPLKAHENILIFYKKQPVFNPQKQPAIRNKGRVRSQSADRSSHYGAAQGSLYEDNGSRFPTSVIKISNHNGAIFGDISNVVKHPTQKPVELFEWLIKSYSREGDIVLDNCMGSGTTAIACMNTGRDFIGFENNRSNYDTSAKRITNYQIKKGLGKNPALVINPISNVN